MGLMGLIGLIKNPAIVALAIIRLFSWFVQ
jgi:hypothetical protein